MAFLVIAGLTVPVLADARPVERIQRIGAEGRAWAGNLRSHWRAEKRSWGVTTGLLTNAEAGAIKTAVASAAKVVCSGTLISTAGGTVTCEVEVGDGGYVTTKATDGTGVLRSLTLTLREV